MTSRDYRLLAKVIDSLPDRVSKKVLVHQLSIALLADNPRFDNARWLSACGIPVDSKEHGVE